MEVFPWDTTSSLALVGILLSAMGVAGVYLLLAWWQSRSPRHPQYHHKQEH